MAEAKTKSKAAKRPAEKKPAQKAAKKPTAKTKGLKKKPEEKPKEKKVEEKPKPKEEKKEKPKVEEKPKEKKEAPKPKVEHPTAKIKYKPPKTTPGRKLPKFNRQEYPRYKRLDGKWRTPTGIDSKKLEKQRGKGYLPSIGYKKPNTLAGLQYGFRPVRVFNVGGLKAVDPKREAAVIASAVGRRKRNMIIEEANKLAITVLNPRRGEV